MDKFESLSNETIRYIVVDAGTFPYACTPSRRKLVAQFPELPLGDWTTIRLTRNASDKNLAFHSAEKVELPGVESIWHLRHIDYLDLMFQKSFTHNV